jgi:hypothetical protein
MTKHFKNILRGVGSIMDIAPFTDYRRFVPKENIQERMHGHWARTGRNIQHAVKRFTNEQKKIQK